MQILKFDVRAMPSHARQLSMLPGVHHVGVTYVAGSATVHYDESDIAVEALRQRVIDSGYHCHGELVPAHVCDQADHKTSSDSHAGHARLGGADGQGVTINSSAKAATTPVRDAKAGHGEHGPHAGHSAAPAAQKGDLMHDMGHAPGMSMCESARMHGAPAAHVPVASGVSA